MESMLRSLQAEGRAGSQNVLCEFRAGKLNLKPNNMMHADPRRGLIRLKRDEGDGLIHFQWLERIKGVMGAPSRTNLEDDLIIFPQEAVMKKLQQAGDRRIYVLKFQQGDRKLFFWFQEEDASGDEDFVKKVNVSLNGEEAPAEVTTTSKPAGAGGDSGGSGPGSGPGSGSGSNNNNNNNNNNSKQEPPSGGDKKEEEGGGGGDDKGGSDAVPMDATTTEKEEEGQDGQDGLTAHPLEEHAFGTAGDGGAGVSQADLAAALLAAATSVQEPSGPSLTEVLKPDTIIPLLRNKEIQERLAEYLPEEHRHEAAILELAASPQFQQQLETFSQALQSGQLNLNAFGIPHNALTVADFLRSIESISTQEEEKGEEKNGTTNGK